MEQTRYNHRAYQEGVKARHGSVGDADTKTHEFMENQQRDMTAVLLNNRSMLALSAMGQNVSNERLRQQLLTSYAMPCGPKPDDPFEKLQNQSS
eukprot:Clim_evm15s54 gene=Clim_evmTU15s54